VVGAVEVGHRDGVRSSASSPTLSAPRRDSTTLPRARPCPPFGP
jgi:hypothetical protein